LRTAGDVMRGRVLSSDFCGEFRASHAEFP
jgi:hypothetical protein